MTAKVPGLKLIVSANIRRAIADIIPGITAGKHTKAKTINFPLNFVGPSKMPAHVPIINAIAVEDNAIIIEYPKIESISIS
jgi:hypothetical protein